MNRPGADLPPRAPPLRFDRAAIEALIPHRPPFLLIDRVEDLHPGEHGAGFWHVLPEDPHLIRTQDGSALLPAVMVLEAMAQTALVVAASAADGGAASVLLRAVERAGFRARVPASSLLCLACRRKHRRGAVWTSIGTATVGGRVVATARFCAVVGTGRGLTAPDL